MRPDSANKSIPYRFTASFGLFCVKSTTPVWRPNGGGLVEYAIHFPRRFPQNSSEIHGKSVPNTRVRENTSISILLFIATANRCRVCYTLPSPCGAVGSFWLEALIRFHRSKAVIATQNYIINIKSRLRLDLTLPGAFFAERNSFVTWLNFFRRGTAQTRCCYAVLFY